MSCPLVYRLFIFVLLISANSCKPLEKQPAAAGTPLDDLLEGNARFAAMHPSHPHESKKRMLEIAAAQHPFAVVVCCSDSRVPPEIIFDQGLGDLFVVRTAGNLMGSLEIGSIEYAVEHLGVKQVVIMGHRECGAIKAFTSGAEAPGSIHAIVDSIKAEQEIRQLPADDKDLFNDCIRANILHGVHQLKNQSNLLEEKCRKGELQLIGACYDLQKGLVEIVKE
jgi:carbonic anhydrase